MMTGRAHGAEGVATAPGRHLVHRRHHRPGGAQRRLTRLSGDEGVGVQLDDTVVHWNRGQDTIDVSLSVNAQ